jgi:hypothetical protein
VHETEAAELVGQIDDRSERGAQVGGRRGQRKLQVRLGGDGAAPVSNANGSIAVYINIH